MLRREMIGKADKYEKAVLSGFPRYRYKEYQKALGALVRKGYVISRPKPHGTKYALDPRRVREIIEVIENLK
ncbi:MAG: hypothetical protein GXO65_00365 [Euryarchaeota archaeon]|nr:hypothetical protein [Euryarchaeota archaeon]